MVSHPGNLVLTDILMNTMCSLPIVQLNRDTLHSPYSALRQVCKEVDVTNDSELTAAHGVITEMFRSLYADPSGVALAAQQIGILQQIVVISYHDRDSDASPLMVLINPRVRAVSSETEEGEEVCLSVPRLSGIVDRAKTVEVEGYDQQGVAVKFPASGFLGRIVQHEVDHLAGVLFVDRAKGDLKGIPDFPDRRLEPTVRKLKLRPRKHASAPDRDH